MVYYSQKLICTREIPYLVSCLRRKKCRNGLINMRVGTFEINYINLMLFSINLNKSTVLFCHIYLPSASTRNKTQIEKCFEKDTRVKTIILLLTNKYVAFPVLIIIDILLYVLGKSRKI